MKEECKEEGGERMENMMKENIEKEDQEHKISPTKEKDGGEEEEKRGEKEEAN